MANCKEELEKIIVAENEEIERTLARIHLKKCNNCSAEVEDLEQHLRKFRLALAEY